MHHSNACCNLVVASQDGCATTSSMPMYSTPSAIYGVSWHWHSIMI